MSSPTYYDILSLPPSLRSAIPAQTLRTAYRRALLQNHPDKSSPSSKSRFSIDQIARAFAILGDAKARAEYDRELAQKPVVKGTVKEEFKTGVETVDLDELEEGEGVWWRGCRCGDDRGFEVQEGDLEDAIKEGEITVGCKGCSLWLKVLFGVVDEE